MRELDSAVLNQLFRTARSCNEWEDKAVGDETVEKLYDLLKFGPTSANSSPARFVWVRSTAAKSQLAAIVSEGNRSKIVSAPLIAVIGNDLDFADSLPKLLPENRARKMQEMFQDASLAEVTAMRNGSLQGAYLMVAARALGIDCGPMSGFDHDAVDELFFSGTRTRSNFLCCLGFGKQPPFTRNPRLSFSEASRFA